MSLDLVVKHGKLRVSSGGVDGVLAISGNVAAGSKALSLQGGLLGLQNVLGKLEYQSDSAFVGNDTLAVSVDDRGNTGSGGILTATASAPVVVSAAATGLVIHVPTNGLVVVTEDTATVISGFSLAATNLAATTVIDVTLVARHGTMRLVQQSELIVSSGDIDNGAPKIRFRGQLAHVNAALATLTYVSKANFNGLWKNDGRTDRAGAIPGTSLEAIELVAFAPDHGDAAVPMTKSCMVSVMWVNDPPVINAPAAVTTVEDTAVSLQSISVTDVDADEIVGGKVEVTITASTGTISMDLVVIARSAVRFLEGSGAASAKLRFEASPARINAAMATLLFHPPANFVGTGSITILARDFGNSGVGTEGTATHIIVVSTTSVYDAVAITSPVSVLQAVEDVDHRLLLGLQHLDVKSDDEVEVSISATIGSVALSIDGGVKLAKSGLLQQLAIAGTHAERTDAVQVVRTYGGGRHEVQSIQVRADTGQTVAVADVLLSLAHGGITETIAVSLTTAHGTEQAIKSQLELMKNVGEVEVSRSTADTQGGHSWLITFKQSGNIPTLTASPTAVPATWNGAGAQVLVTEKVQGTTTVPVQSVSLVSGGVIGAGTFQLEYVAKLDDHNPVSAQIAYDASAADVQVALNTLETVGHVQVTGSSPTWTVTFVTQTGIIPAVRARWKHSAEAYVNAYTSTVCDECTPFSAGFTEVAIAHVNKGSMPLGGSFALTYNGFAFQEPATTRPIAFDATAGDVMQALVALPNIVTVRVERTGGKISAQPHTVTPLTDPLIDGFSWKIIFDAPAAGSEPLL